MTADNKKRGRVVVIALDAADGGLLREEIEAGLAALEEKHAGGA